MIHHDSHSRAPRFAWLLLLATLALSACDPGAECTEVCSEDDDCIAGHACIEFVDGKQCAPVECKSCQHVCEFTINPHSETVKHCNFTACRDD
jgi:hypothetical protein